MDPLDLLRTEFTVLVVSSADGQNTIDIPSALREQAIIDPVPALSSTALKTRPDYQSIVKELHSHLLLVPLLTIKTADDQKYSRLSNSFNAKGVAEMNIDSSIRCFMSYFFILQKTQPLGERDRTAMLTMVQNGLVPLLMKIVINFLKYDDREWEETTTKQLGWLPALEALQGISSIFLNNFPWGSEINGLAIAWGAHLELLFEALSDHEGVWGCIQDGPKLGLRVKSLRVCHALVNITKPIRWHMDWPKELDTPTIHSEARLVAKLRHCMVTVEDLIVDSELNDKTAMSLADALQVLVDRKAAPSDVPYLTGLSLDDIIRQTIGLVSIEEFEREKTARTMLQLRSLNGILHMKNSPSEWADSLSRLQFFTGLVLRAQSCLLHLLGKEPAAARKAFIAEITAAEPVTPLRCYLELMMATADVAEAHSSSGIFTEIIESKALLVAEMVSLVHGGGLTYVPWAASFFRAYKSRKLYHDAKPLLEKATEQLRTIATRSHFELEARPGYFPSIDRIKTSWDLSPVAQGFLAKLSSAKKQTTIWEILYLEHAAILRPQSLWEASNFLPRPAETCSATGCENLGPPQMKCSKCKETYYCDRDCQRRAWKWHKSICRQGTDTRS